MRVLEVSPYDLAAPGGVQGQVLGLAAALESLGAEVTVAGPNAAACGGLDLGQGVPVPGNGSVARVALDPLPLARLRGCRGVDVVHLHEPIAPLVAQATLSLLGDLPVVGTFHRSGVSLWYRAWGRAVRPLTERLSAAVAVSPMAAETATLGAGVRVDRVIRNGIDLKRFSAPGKDVPGNRILFVGRLEPRKGVTVLLEAIRGLGAPGASLTIIGDGPLRPAVAAAATRDPRIRVLGRVGDDELVKELTAADLLVAPSISGESFGVILLEGMAAGCAVIASDIPAYRQVLGDRGFPSLVPPGSAEQLALAIDEVCSSSDLASLLRQDGMERIPQYDFQEVAREYLALFASLV